jgi:carbonic anhydrase
LLPAERGFFRYMGSLTTPPCSEGITWSVMRSVIEASPDQIRKFAALFANNARPAQVRNRRYLLQTS